MKPYEIIARRAETYLTESRDAIAKTEITQGFNVTVKDSTLSRILSCADWLDRMPGSKEKKAPYTKRIWDCYLKVQSGNLDDTTMIPQLIGGNRIEYLEDQAVEPSIADSGIGTGGLGYASIQEQSIGTQYRQKPKDPYWNDKIPKSECRTLEGEEKEQAYEDYKKNTKIYFSVSLNRPIEEE
jgi:hypothetical protein